MSESKRATENAARPLPVQHSRTPRLLAGVGQKRSFGVPGSAVAGVFAVLLLGGVALAVAYPHLPPDQRPGGLPPQAAASRATRPTTSLLGEFGEERRNFVAIDQDPRGR